MSLQKNVASQKWVVLAWTIATNVALAGDAAQITANLRLDGGAANAVDDTNPTELEDGYYAFDLTQAETNADNIVICPASSTGGVAVIGCPPACWTDGIVALAADVAAVHVHAAGAETQATAAAADVVNIDGAAMRGTDSAALAASWTAALATALGNYTAARAAFLDNINQAGLLQVTAARAALLDQITALRLAELDAANLPTDIDAILVDTAVIGALGAGLTAITDKTNLIPSDPADESLIEAAITAAHATTNGKIDAVDDYVDTEVGAIKAVTDKVDTALVVDGAVYQFTANALELAPTGGSAPTVAQIADGVWDEAIGDHLGVGSTGEALDAAGGGATPASIADAVWDEIASGHVTAGSLGKKVTDLLQVFTGKWAITNNQLIMYDSDGTTPLYTFNLKQDGTPSEFNPDERTPV